MGCPWAGDALYLFLLSNYTNQTCYRRIFVPTWKVSLGSSTHPFEKVDRPCRKDNDNCCASQELYFVRLVNVLTDAELCLTDAKLCLPYEQTKILVLDEGWLYGICFA